MTTPIITFFHGQDISVHLKKEGEQTYKDLFIKGDYFLPISENWKNKLIELGCPKDKIIVHHMGINVDDFKYTERASNEKTILISVARLVEKKGIVYGIHAVKELVDRGYTKIEYQIIGEGNQKTLLLETVNQLKLESYVKFLGWKTTEEVAELLSKADIFIAPSVTASDGDQEGIPVVLMEAMAIGLPVVSTLHSGIPELVISGVTGITVPEREAESLSNAIISLIDNPAMRTSFANGARKFVVENFNVNILNDKLSTILN